MSTRDRVEALTIVRDASGVHIVGSMSDEGAFTFEQRVRLFHEGLAQMFATERFMRDATRGSK